MKLTICHRHELGSATMAALLELAVAVRRSNHLGESIMSKIKDFADAVNASFDKVTTDISGVRTEISVLQDEINALQTSAGTITPEDQALLDAIQKRAADIGTSLDAMQPTPPTPPAEEPAPAPAAADTTQPAEVQPGA